LTGPSSRESIALVSSTVDHYTGSGPVAAVVSALEAAGLGSGPLTLEDVAPISEFHTAGRAATLALADAAGLREGMRVLDAGGGVAGPAMVLASLYGCTVTSLDLTPEFCRLGELLVERTGHAERVTVVEGNALSPPFGDASFDAVWTQHAQMNIEDKPRLYRELRRVVVDGGTLAFWDVVAGDGTPIHLPVPWASDSSQSFLAGFDELREIVRAQGFEERLAEDGTEEAFAFVKMMEERFAAGPPPLGMHLLVPNAPAKFESYDKNLREGKIRLLRGVYTAV
jgi:MPBQ/MSBQ methyltransferase